MKLFGRIGVDQRNDLVGGARGFERSEDGPAPLDTVGKVLVDDSGSMEGEKSSAATQGAQEMILECQPRGGGPAGRSSK